ncbi:MAG: helix-turn-helix transcriptional regulator [Cyanobacteria bacterium P01_F01_bin.150]
MKTGLSVTELQQAVTNFENKFTSQFPLESNNILLTIPPALGHGYMRVIRLSEGLELCVQKFIFKKDVALHFNNISQWSTHANLGFCLSGQCSGTFTDIQTNLTIGPRKASFCIIPDSAGVTEFTAREHLHTVDIILDSHLLPSLIGQELIQLPQVLQHAIRPDACHPFVHLSDMSNEIAQVLQQIMGCPYHGRIRNVYLEGKVLELVALYFGQFFQRSKPVPFTLLNNENADRLHEARRILKQNLITPPTIKELSQKVGLSERSLQKGFRDLFGTTVFALLHNERMEYARYLLETQQMSVGHIATMIGISHRGYFAKAFKRKFGTTPKEYAKRALN